jgi:hypothetical protein
MRAAFSQNGICVRKRAAFRNPMFALRTPPEFKT